MLIICLLLFAIGCAISASNKNRNVVGWFILGILLGPFGLLCILLLNPKEKHNISISIKNAKGLKYVRTLKPNPHSSSSIFVHL